MLTDETTTMQAIDYLSYFMSTRTFKEMTYWRELEEAIQKTQNAVAFLSNELKAIFPKLKNELEYLATR
jgi:hypothetical protein